MADESNSESQARAQLASVVAMVKRLEHAGEFPGGEVEASTCTIPDAELLDAIGEYSGAHVTEEMFALYHDEDAARERIEEDALSVEMRDDWYMYRDASRINPVEYRILLCTGGPAVRIIGEFNDFGDPETARIEHQDWGTPWTELNVYDCPHNTQDNGEHVRDGNCGTIAAAALLTYARVFYFGEGC